MDIGDGDTTTRKVAVVEHGTGSGGRRVFSRGKKVAMEGENSQQGCEFASWAWTVFMPASSDRLLVLFLMFAPLHKNPCHLDFLLVSSSRPRELCDVEYFPIWTYHQICYRVKDDRFTCQERRRNRELSVKRMEEDSVASVQSFDIAPLGRYLCPVEF